MACTQAYIMYKCNNKTKNKIYRFIIFNYTLNTYFSCTLISSLLVFLLELDDLLDVRLRDLLHVPAVGAVPHHVQGEGPAHVEPTLEAHLRGRRNL